MRRLSSAIGVNETSLILGEEIYATAAMVGGLTYCLTISITPSEYISLLAGGSVGFVIRACAIHFDWSLPKRSPRL